LLLVGSVVIHVALAWVTLAPGVFVRDHVLCFGKIGGALILRWDQIIRLHQNPMRRYVMNVARVVVRVWVLGEESGEWIDPGTRADQVLGAV